MVEGGQQDRAGLAAALIVRQGNGFRLDDRPPAEQPVPGSVTAWCRPSAPPSRAAWDVPSAIQDSWRPATSGRYASSVARMDVSRALQSAPNRPHTFHVITRIRLR
jgi:hypothetical protein